MQINNGLHELQIVFSRQTSKRNLSQPAHLKYIEVSGLLPFISPFILS